MHAFLSPVAPNESSLNVAMLQEALAALGLPVAQGEVDRSRAGKDTIDKVRELKKQLGVADDGSGAVNDDTIAAMMGALKRRGLLAAARSFTVSGTVRRQDGSPGKRVRLAAFDIDLRAVAVYRTVQSVAEIAKSGAFEPLGHATSDSRGKYQITFYDWQYRRAERNKADVVVYALDEAKGDERVIGRSRLVDSERYSERGLVVGLDIGITQADARTEYEIVMPLLQGFLKESGVSLRDIAASKEQRAFTAGELEIAQKDVDVAAAAEALRDVRESKALAHELLYGVGRQEIALDWAVLHRKADGELRDAIAKSVKQRIIRPFARKAIDAFISALRTGATVHLLDDKASDRGKALNAMLGHALPEKAQRVAFLNALGTYSGGDFQKFWTEHLPAQPGFKGKPRLVASLLLTQQLTFLTGNHQALVAELQVGRKLESIDQLLDLDAGAWLKIVEKTGVPDSTPGNDDEEKKLNYVDAIKGLLDSTYPTQRIARMAKKLPIAKASVKRGVAAFLSGTSHFDFAVSRVTDFNDEIKAAAGKDNEEVALELMKIQRVFQVSTSPEAMTALLENDLHSAYAIAGIPPRSFAGTYAEVLGGEAEAFAIHQRASHMAARSEMTATHMLEFAQSYAPEAVMGAPEHAAAVEALQGSMPNYTELFGSPDLCECEECRSVYSAAAYGIDLLRFLWRGEPNHSAKSPLDMLVARRPDLLHLPLTCENTNTVIPYIDLANEVMEHYTVHDSLAGFEGFDTGEATAPELRANPQNFNLDAYRQLKDAKYPFTLPYNQPLDVIRTYSNHLKVSRYEAMKAINPQPDATTANAIAAEALGISQEEYRVLTGKAFDGSADPTALQVYFGYAAPGDLENMSAVPEFLRRSGIAYTDLVDLVSTRFVNPYQGTLDFLQEIFSYVTVDAADLYARLALVEAGTLDPATDADIVAALAAHNAAHGTAITPAQFGQWVVDHLGEFRQVITLFEPDSKCDLATTKLRTIQSIYGGSAASGVSNAAWSKVHRLIRLWRKLGWTLHETDLMLAALGEDDITPATVLKLESVAQLKAATKAPIDQLAVLWGNIDTYGDKSLYRKLFLNRAVQQIDAAFQPDGWGDYLQDGEILSAHRSALLAAFRIREEDLAAILEVATVIDGGVPRALDLDTDALSVANLTTIFRHAALARLLKMRIDDMCRLIALFGVFPFSTWNVQLEEFVEIAPADSCEFQRLAEAVRKSGFKAATLEYVLKGTLPAGSNIALDKGKARRAAKAVRDAFAAIEQDHPDAAPAPLAAEVLAAKLALTFQPEIVARFMAVLDGTALFETVTDHNLDVAIPEALSTTYSYVKASGRLTAKGVMPDSDQATLKGLAGANASFQAAVDALHAAAEEFIATNFSGIFADLAEARAALLDHPAQLPPATAEERLVYVYGHFIPVLKRKLRRDSVSQRIASLIGLGEAATALLIAADVDGLIAALSTQGFSAAYFDNATWTAPPALERTDETIAFAWGAGSPDAALGADNFSVRWEAYLAAPASGDYTLVVDVEEADEAFRLYLDDSLILEKTAADAATSWEALATLNAARMHLLRLEYAETAQNAGVLLRWKTATTALDAVPASCAYPAAILDAFTDTATDYHRAANFVTGFKLSDPELGHLMAHGADFGDIDFKALAAGHWQRVADYVALRGAVPQAQALLTDVFALADNPEPVPTVAQLRDLLGLASAWDAASLAFLVGTQFGMGVADFRNEIALDRLREVMRIVGETGLSAETIAAWGAAQTDFDNLNATAQWIKNTVKAKYEEEDWLDLAGGLSDKIRERQKQALVGYLLTRPAIQAWGAQDADGLFEYFLIDVQMCACMDTSRIVQANAAVQMFVNRCLLNLESDTTSGVEEGVSPGAIDKDRWEWMKNYRVWEANRKIFLYAENWLEPEWRNDRSEFFRELESYLVQNDITDTSVEQAFRNYLASLSEVAHLEVCGLHREDHDDGKLKFMHVFARTHNAPYKFFYRCWNESGKWSGWQKVPLDIRCVDDGNNSGVHVIPVIWKKRLFLFSPEFRPFKDSPDTSTKSAVDCSTDPMSTLEAQKYWEIHLAWSEFVGGKWTPKQVTKEFIKQAVGNAIERESRIRWIYGIDAEQRLQIVSHTEFDEAWVEMGAFYLSDITSPMEVFASPMAGPVAASNGYGVSFMNYAATGKLDLADDVYLQNETTHKLLITPTREDYAFRLVNPFFFSDVQRTYFVRPVQIAIRERVKDPGLYQPYLPGLRAEVPQTVPIPHYGPDDYMPVDIMSAQVSGGPSPYALGSGAPIEQAFAAPSQPFALRALTTPPSKAYATMDRATIGDAFSGATRIAYGPISGIRYDKGLEFHTFYHPFSSDFVTNLNQGGLSRGSKPLAFPAGLMESDTEIASDDGATFVSSYAPNFNDGFVQKPADFDTRTYYKENVCFDPKGANSLYNWELFFHAPLYIATRLSRNGRYEEALKWFHYIFDPTTDAMPGPGESETSRYWKVLPFKTTPAESLEDWFRDLGPNADPDSENGIIAQWRDSPFDPHLVASNWPLKYMKHVVLKYEENLVAWADSLFRQFSRESVNEALQIYVIASHVLGPRPQFVPKRGVVKAETYDSLKTKWDDFSNALVALENIFPYSSEAAVSSTSAGTSLLGLGSALYFCIPPNDKLLGYWDTVADRLFKIRHCQDIDGVERQLALFSPPIDPAALVQAASQGLSLGSILADLSSPPPNYRFTYLLQRANEFCGEVKALGGALLAAAEKIDVETLGRLRASHETQLLDITTAVRERQVLEARSNRENLAKVRETANFRLQHYLSLLGNEPITPPAPPTVDAALTVDSQLPADTTISTIETDADVSLVASDESGIKVISKEKQEVDAINTAREWQIAAHASEGIAAILHIIPTVSGDGKPFGIGAGVSWGGTQLGNAFSAAGKVLDFVGSFSVHESVLAAKMASYIRREQDWVLQANLAAREITQIDKQITSADIRVQIAEKELGNHLQQISNSQDVEQFLADKFTGEELYQWMKEQLFAVYKQGYDLAHDMAKKAEKAYKYETGAQLASFIQYGYWESSMQGLLAGERLQLALRQMEKSFLEENRRELELNKSISLARLDPVALIELRETGKCRFSVPEELLDLDFRGHYFRRIKSVSLSIPCVAGPYTSVSCTLRLMENSVRINTSMNGSGAYEHENDAGQWIDDDRFRTIQAPVTAIATSTGQNDYGLFEFNLRDERYLPFEGAGAISDWQVELAVDKELRPFDYATIPDVILHMAYTARENGGPFKDAATTYIKNFLMNASDVSEQPLMQMLSLKREFPSAWYAFLHPAVEGAEQVLDFTLGKDRFPFFVQDRDVVVEMAQVFAQCTHGGSYDLIVSYTKEDDETATSSQITVPQSDKFGGLNLATINATDAGLALEELDVSKPMSLKLKQSGVLAYTGLGTAPDEVVDAILVLHYKLGP